MPLKRKAARASAENGRGYGDRSAVKKSRIDAMRRTVIMDKEVSILTVPHIHTGSSF
jgi:hypothetical protein